MWTKMLSRCFLNFAEEMADTFLSFKKRVNYANLCVENRTVLTAVVFDLDLYFLSCHQEKCLFLTLAVKKYLTIAP